MFWRGAVLLVAAMMMSGCVTEQSGAPVPMAQTNSLPRTGQGRIVLLRERGYMGMAVGWEVKVDGQSMVDLKNGTYISADLPAGRHQLTSTLFGFPGTTERDIQVSAGQTYFFLTKLSDRANGLTVLGAVGGLAGYAVAAAATSNIANPGPLELQPLDEPTARRIIADLQPAQ